MKNRLAVTVDIEDWYHLPPFTGAPNSRFKDVPGFFKIWKSRYDYLTKPTLKVLDLLQQYRITGTFFIVADVAFYYSGLVEEIAKRGHEIACHGLHHACKINPKTKQPLMSPEEFKQRTILAKSILEQVSGKKVIGYRAPNAYIGGWMIDILEEIGFRYDSSVCVNSIYNKADSCLKGISSKPYYPRSGGLEPGNNKRDIIEIPWPYFSILLKFPAAGGPALRILGAGYIKRGLKESLARGDTVFYFHPIDITEEAFPSNSFTNKVFWISKGDRVFNGIKEILSDPEFTKTTCSDLLE